MGLFLVIQTSVRTKQHYEMALLRRSLRLYSSLHRRNIPRNLHMHSGAEAVQSKTTGPLLTERGWRIRHSHLQRYYRLVHPDIASAFCLVSTYEAVSKIAIDGVVWTWIIV